MRDDEKLIRLLTDRHFNATGKLKTGSLSIRDITERGVSVVRADHITVNELYEVGEEIRQEAGAKEIRGALVAKAGKIRKLRDKKDNRYLCVKDDPIQNEPRVRDNEAHAIIIAAQAMDEMTSKEIRAQLLEILTAAFYLNDVWGT